MIKIRVFRAVDEPETCQKYIEGHIKLLTQFGITSITSARPKWVDNPYTYVIIAESPDSDKVYGGARVQIANSSEPLPIEEATWCLDPNVSGVVSQYGQSGTGELCGLWNSREIAGMGIGSSFLGRVGVAIAPRLRIKSLFALCAPYTVESCKKAGFELETSIGNNGTFVYPKEHLVATAVVMRNVHTLGPAVETEREYILRLRQTNHQILKEQRKRGNGEYELEFDLNISSFHFNDPEIILSDQSRLLVKKMLLSEMK
jgi:hypothetical protein